MTDSARPPFLPKWLLLLALLTAIGPLSIDMYLPSFPLIAQSLGSHPASVQLTLAVFLVGMASGQLVYGPLSDCYGRKPPLYAGLALYIVASIACAKADSLEILMVARFFQALGGSAGVVISRAVIRDRTSVEEGARAFSLIMLVMGAAPILAPLLGGILLPVIGWRGLFYVLVAVAVFALIAMHVSMQETMPRTVPARARLRGILRDYRELLCDRRMISCAMTGAFNYGGMFSYIAGSPYVFIELFGVAPQHFGWLFGLNAFGFILASQLNARLVMRLGAGRLLRRIIWVPVAAALLALLPILLGVYSLPLLMLSLFVYMSTMGFVAPNAMALALAEQGQRAGAASALIGTLQFLIGTLGGVTVSLWHAPSALPLAAAMVFFACGGWLVHRFGVEPIVASGAPPLRS